MKRPTKTGRPLTPEDKTVWNKVAKTVTPRRPGRAKGESTLDEFANMMRVPTLMPRAKHTPSHPAPLKADKNVRRGRVKVDAKIDLHDMTREQARPALVRAVMRAAKHNKSCLLVVTGKGARLEGVLRQSFQNWVNDADIRPHIASYAPAHIRHGGSGAWYVFLKSD